MEVWTNCNPDAFEKFKEMDATDAKWYMATISSRHTDTAYAAFESWCSGGKKASAKIGKADVSFRREEEQLIIRMSREDSFLEYHSTGESLSYPVWQAETRTGLFILKANLNSQPITSEGVLEHLQSFTVQTSADWDTLERREKDKIVKLTHIIYEEEQITSIRFMLKQNILRMDTKEHQKEELGKLLATYRKNCFHPTVWRCDKSDEKSDEK